MRLDASTEKVNISKETKFENAVQLNQGQSIKWTHVFIREVQGATRPEFHLIVNGSTSHLRLWVAGAIKQAITNTTIACKVNIDAEQGRTVFNRQQLKSNIINSNGNNTLNIQQNNNSFITLLGDTLNRVQVNRFLRVVDSGGSTQCHFVESTNGNYMDFRLGNHINAYASGASSGNTLHLNYYSHANVFLGTNQDTSPDNPPTISINKFSSDTGNAFEVQGDSVFSGSVSTNTVNSEGDNDLVISRNNIPFLTLDKFIEDTVEKEAIICSKQLRANGQFRINKLKVNQITTGLDNFCDIRLEDNNSILRFFVGNPNDVNLQIIKTDTLNEILLNRNTKCSQTFYTDTIDTNTDTDLVINRNGTEFVRLKASDFTIRMNYALISTNTYIDNHRPTAFGVDTFFYGNNSTDNGYIEYFRFNHTNQRCDYFVNINSNSNITCVNLVETSDKRLKDNIENVDEDCSEIVKKVNVKTYNLKSDNKKKHHIGFIAQEIKEILPKKFEAVVNEDNEFMGINYGKMSAILWKCCQEQQSKIEHLEARLFELEDIVKDKKKSTPKSKAKAKS